MKKIFSLIVFIATICMVQNLYAHQKGGHHHHRQNIHRPAFSVHVNPFFFSNGYPKRFINRHHARRFNHGHPRAFKRRFHRHINRPNLRQCPGPVRARR